MRLSEYEILLSIIFGLYSCLEMLLFYFVSQSNQFLNYQNASYNTQDIYILRGKPLGILLPTYEIPYHKQRISP